MALLCLALQSYQPPEVAPFQHSDARKTGRNGEPQPQQRPFTEHWIHLLLLCSNDSQWCWFTWNQYLRRASASAYIAKSATMPPCPASDLWPSASRYTLVHCRTCCFNCSASWHDI